MNQWAEADRISDRIIDLLNEELKQPNFSPLQLFAAQLLALMAMLRTAPRRQMPAEMLLVEEAARICLQNMMATKQ